MKKHSLSALLVLASACLLMGCTDQSNYGAMRRRPLIAESSDFTVTTNLEETKEIHTERQKEYLSYDGNYDTIPEADYPDGQKHLSDPEPVNLAWEYTPISGKTLTRYDMKVGKEANLSDGYVIKGTSSTSLDIYNSYLGDNYFQIIANYDDGSKDESAIQKYEVDNVYPRNLKIDGMTNCRDMGGGRVLENGGTIKQGLLYRTSSTNNWAYGRGDVADKITTNGKEVLLNQLGCKTEINVNNSDDHFSDIPNYVAAKMYYDNGKHHLYRNGEPLKEVFHTLSDINNYPIFYHCRIGTDRTGLCGIMISGLLGVPENLIYQDYLFSNFGNIQEKRYIGEKAGRDNILNYINDLKTYPGEKFQNKVYNYLLSIGVPASELNSVIDILTEGNKAEGNDNYQEVILADEFAATGAEMQTVTSQAHPKKYYTLTKGASIKVEFDPKYTADAKLVAYLGSTKTGDDNTNHTLFKSLMVADSISATLDGYDVDIDEEMSFYDVGFGQGDGRTYYSAVMLGDVQVIAGMTEVIITGKDGEPLNIGAIALIPTSKVSVDAPVIQPTENSSKGCGGSIVTTTSLIALVALSGVSVLIFRKRKEN